MSTKHGKSKFEYTASTDIWIDICSTAIVIGMDRLLVCNHRCFLGINSLLKIVVDKKDRSRSCWKLINCNLCDLRPMDVNMNFMI